MFFRPLNESKGKELNYAKLFVVFFWINFFFTSFNIVTSIAIIFIPPSLASNAQIGEELYLGFYYLLVGTPNFANVSFVGIVSAVFICLNVGLITICYWFYKNSRFTTVIEATHLSTLLILCTVTLIILFLVNVFNHPVFDLKDLDIVNNGWNSNISDNNYIMSFNYVYSIHFVNSEGAVLYAAFIASKFFGIWVFLSVTFVSSIMISLLVLFYNKNVSLNYFRNWGPLYV